LEQIALFVLPAAEHSEHGESNQYPDPSDGANSSRTGKTTKTPAASVRFRDQITDVAKNV
jgi:hypothetical protein